MTQAKDGDTVRVHYTGKLEDGSVFDTSRGGEPLEFTIGAGQIIPGFEKAIIGMEPGNSKTIKIPSEEAYGPRREDMMVVVEKSQFPEDIKPVVGQELQIRQGDGLAIPVTVVEVTESKVTLDANHPLAGKDLTFDIELIEIL
ncbi:MAG TPA: peptidylprolyl isomerase [Thermoplasmata archaeon]|nr:peptidylprolyl isomerase [Thermoplasmata archaeon]